MYTALKQAKELVAAELAGFDAAVRRVRKELNRRGSNSGGRVGKLAAKVVGSSPTCPTSREKFLRRL